MQLILLSFAVYRVARFVILDTLIAAPRMWVHAMLLGRTGKIRAKLYELITCPYCISIWLAAAATWAADIVGSVPVPMFTWLAASTGSLLTWNAIED